jgi:ATP-dependent DNA ligase
LLSDHGRCLQSEPLSLRREALAELCNVHKVAGMAFSAGAIGTGIAFYTAALAAGQEGVMAKQLLSCYRPGQRSSAWRKIKPGRHVKPEQP